MRDSVYLTKVNQVYSSYAGRTVHERAALGPEPALRPVSSHPQYRQHVLIWSWLPIPRWRVGSTVALINLRAQETSRERKRRLWREQQEGGLLVTGRPARCER